LTGRRRVPILVNANWLPFLRFKKPQSPYLTRVLRDKLLQKQRRMNALVGVEDVAEIGEAEAAWERVVRKEVEGELEELEEGGGNGEGARRWFDRVVDRQGQRERMIKWLNEGDGREFGEVGNGNGNRNGNGNGNWGGVGASTWTIETTKVRKELSDRVHREQQKAFKTGLKMFSIVERERKLWEIERRERKQAKKQRVVKVQKPGRGNNGSGRSNVSEGSVKWETERVELKPEMKDGMIKQKLTARQNAQLKKGKAIEDSKAGDRGSSESQIVGMAKLEAETADAKPESDEWIMERRLLAILKAELKADLAHKNDKATF
jgi:hypothetical protein